MQLFYNERLTNGNSEILFDKEESRHIGKVLRKKEGDRLFITNGNGSIFEAQLLSVNPKQCLAKVLNIDKQRPLPYSLHLAVAPTKLNDRYEWFLEKATEIGISEITPIICDHSERKVIKHERYEKILQSAMKQSLKAYLPKLNGLVSFKEFISGVSENSHNFIAHCEDSEKQSLKSHLTSEGKILILIGPEGDFSEKEIEMALKKGFDPISLGQSRLRTETAAVVACHSVAYSFQK